MPDTNKSANHPVIVQFLHPGSEYTVRGRSLASPVSIPWVDGDCCNHTRRFVSHEGEYVDGKGKSHTAKLGFWTEWEACSTAVRMPTPDHACASVFAQWVHTLKSPLQSSPGNQNTDPCVFGETFKYCNCKQRGDGVMRNLGHGSVVLFGSYHKNLNQFTLDTVFVVDGDGIPYGNGRADGIKVSSEYHRLTLENVWEGDYTFYRGRKFQPEDVCPYSFTPSRIFNKDDFRCGERFVLDIDKVNRCLQGSNTKLNPTLQRNLKIVRAQQDVIYSVWKEVLRQVRAAGFLPAVHFDWSK